MLFDKKGGRNDKQEKRFGLVLFFWSLGFIFFDALAALGYFG